MSAVLVSVVVPTYRRDALLERCLAALVAQDFDPSAYEILIVDDAGSDATRRLVRHWAESTTALQFTAGLPPTVAALENAGAAAGSASLSLSQNTLMKVENLPAIRYLAVDQRCHGPSIARNLGWRAADGQIIAFTDDDCLPQPDWIKQGVLALDGMDGVSGQVIVPLPEKPTDYELNTRGLERSLFVTANCFYRKAALEQAGGFDERFRIAWREDTDLYFTLLEQGCRLGRAPAAVVIHPVRPAQWGVSLGQQRKNLYNALLYKKHPRSYRHVIQAWPPLLYYLILAALAAALYGFLTRSPLVEWAGLAAWAALAAFFCARRLHSTSKRLSHVLEMMITSIFIPFAAIYWRLRGAVQFRVLFL